MNTTTQPLLNAATCDWKAIGEYIEGWFYQMGMDRCTFTRTITIDLEMEAVLLRITWHNKHNPPRGITNQWAERFDMISEMTCPNHSGRIQAKVMKRDIREEMGRV